MNHNNQPQHMLFFVTQSSPLIEVSFSGINKSNQIKSNQIISFSFYYLFVIKTNQNFTFLFFVLFVSIVVWGVDSPWLWGANVGHLWRTTGDINRTFTSPLYYSN
jgi:hypothetical protein